MPATTKAARRTSEATPAPIAARRSMSQRPRARENTRMAAVSHPALVEFANHFKQPAAPGIEVVDTPWYRITMQPDYPIPGPNSVSWIRCDADDADEVIYEVRAAFALRHLPLMWILDPDTEPADFADRMAAHGVMPGPRAPELAVMVLPAAASLNGPMATGLVMHDALADPELFRLADAVNAEAFGDGERGVTPEQVAAQERRRQDQIAAGNRRVVLATIDGEPAGSAGLTLYPPAGAIINGGAVREKFRGRGLYRAMVAVRLDMAREAGAPGIAVWGGPMSAPILSKLGFHTVGWRKFYLDNPSVLMGT